jgi:hypothetical protein
MVDLFALTHHDVKCKVKLNTFKDEEKIFLYLLSLLLLAYINKVQFNLLILCYYIKCETIILRPLLTNMFAANFTFFTAVETVQN